MPDRHPPHDAEDDVPGVEGRAEDVPSDVAQSRLSGALRDRAGAYRHEAAVDLTIVDALLRLNEPEAAVRQLDGHRASLQAMAHDLQVAVADAAVEREAERVYQACAEALTPATPRGGMLRRRVLAVASAAAVALALLLPSGRLSPRATLASLVDRRAASDEVTAARERLEAARSLARALRDDTPGPAGARGAAAADSYDLVRHKVRSILATQVPGTANTSTTTAGDVTDLAQERAQRRSERPHGETAGDGGDTAPVIPLPQRGPGAPVSPEVPEPSKGGVGLDPSQVERPAVGERPLAEPTEVPAPPTVPTD